MKAIKPLSVDAQVLYGRLKQIEPEEPILYQELSEVIGRDVQKGARYVLDAALKVALREDRIVFGTIRGEGIVRLPDVGIVDKGAGGISRLRRLARRHAKILACVKDFDSLPNEHKIRHNSHLSIFGAIRQFTRPAAVARVEAAVNAAQAVIPAAKTLEAFRN
jgi:hypothetical protein